MAPYTAYMLLYFYFLSFVNLPTPTIASQRFRIMTFNTLFTGADVKDGLEKVATTILYLNPDIVAIQEVTNTSVFAKLLDVLGGQWSGVTRPGPGFSCVGILTTHTLVPSTTDVLTGIRGIGAQVQLKSGQKINFWCIHPIPDNDAPPSACIKEVTVPMQLLASEASLGDFGKGNGRLGNAIAIAQHEPFLDQLDNSDNIPVILGGDFNSPSYLDWVETTRHLHCNWTFEWPTTRILNHNLLATAIHLNKKIIFMTDGETTKTTRAHYPKLYCRTRGISAVIWQIDAAMTDAFRELYPNPLTHPGNTWSTLAKNRGPNYILNLPEPQNRIDMVHYKGRLRPTFATTYQGHGRLVPFPYHQNNDYPSDHRLVYVDFETMP